MYLNPNANGLKNLMKIMGNSSNSMIIVDH